MVIYYKHTGSDKMRTLLPHGEAWFDTHRYALASIIYNMKNIKFICYMINRK